MDYQTDYQNGTDGRPTATHRERGPNHSASAIPSGTLDRMSIASHSDESSGLTVLPPEEALERALPAPAAAELEIEGLTDEEWTAFQEALSSR